MDYLLGFCPSIELWSLLSALQWSTMGQKCLILFWEKYFGHMCFTNRQIHKFLKQVLCPFQLICEVFYLIRLNIEIVFKLWMFCFLHPMFSSFGFLVTLVPWFSFPFFPLAHLALQNVNKDYVIFFCFCNFIAKSDQKPKTKNGMKETFI